MRREHKTKQSATQKVPDAIRTRGGTLMRFYDKCVRQTEIKKKCKHKASMKLLPSEETRAHVVVRKTTNSKNMAAATQRRLHSKSATAPRLLHENVRGGESLWLRTLPHRDKETIKRGTFDRKTRQRKTTPHRLFLFFLSWREPLASTTRVHTEQG